MTRFTLACKKNRISAEKNELWHAEPAPAARMTHKELCRFVTQHTTLSPHELEMGLEMLAERLPELLARGFLVRLPGLGSLRLEYGSEGVERPEDFDTRLIRRPRVVFCPARELTQKTLRQVKFEQDGLIDGGITFGSIDDYRRWQAQQADTEP